MCEPTRDRILRTIQAETEGEPFILGLWEQGSAAMGRADEMSDLDLNLLVADGHVAEGCAAVERALRSIALVERRFELPRPTWHGNWQAFYRLEGTSPYLLIDLCILEESTPNRFLEPELHGRSIVYFDKTGWVTQEPSTPEPVARRIRERLEGHEAMLDLFSPFVRKELLRGREVDALSFYNGLVMPRVIECLRSRYAPWRHSFGMRYLSYDLPPEVYAEVRALLYVSDPQELPQKTEQAVALFRRTLDELNGLDLLQLLEETRSR